MESKRTKQCRGLKILFTILHFLCLFGPFLYFVPYAFYVGEVASKIVLGLSTAVSIVLAAVSVIVDQTAKAGLQRSVLWTLIAGVLFCLDSVKTFIWIMAGTSLLDELVFVKLKNRYSTALISNKELDRRL